MGLVTPRHVKSSPGRTCLLCTVRQIFYHWASRKSTHESLAWLLGSDGLSKCPLPQDVHANYGNITLYGKGDLADVTESCDGKIILNYLDGLNVLTRTRVLPRGWTQGQLERREKAMRWWTQRLECMKTKGGAVSQGIQVTSRANLVAQAAKNLQAVRETRIQSLSQKSLLEKGMAIHSSILAWRIPWTEESGGLQSIGSQRVGLD